MANYPPPAAGQPGWAGAQPYAYGGGRPSMRSLKGLSVALMVLLPIAGLGALLAAVAFFQRASFLDRFLDGQVSLGQAFREGEDADNFIAASIAIYFLVFITTGVVFIVWQWRHAKNAESLGHRTGLGPGWAIGGWFIPVASLVLPCIQIFQSAKGSDRNRRGPGIVVLWAVVFGLGYAVWAFGMGGFNQFDDEGNLRFDSVSDIEDMARGDRIAGTGMIITVIAAGLAMAMVHQLTSRQIENYQAAPTQPPYDPHAGATFGAPPLGAPPPGPPGTYPAPQPQHSPPPPPPPPPPAPPPRPGETPPQPNDGGPAWPAPPG